MYSNTEDRKAINNPGLWSDSECLYEELKRRKP
jgi:hypothetical protein